MFPDITISQVTGDVLFNLPAFHMAKLWSKHVGKTFFYSFEQTMKQNKHGGKEFLPGLPLVENDGMEGGKLICNLLWMSLVWWNTQDFMNFKLNFMDSRLEFIVNTECILSHINMICSFNLYYICACYRALCICFPYKINFTCWGF